MTRPAYAGFVVFGGRELQTIAYVDGYNLYYGRLHDTPHKWLNLKQLIESILRIQNPDFRLIGIKYFTSPVIAKLASRGAASVEAQNAYLKALRDTGGIEIIQGRHQLEPSSAPSYIEGKEADRNLRVPIWNLNEKETDVRLALAMYRDCAKGLGEQTIIVSSDTDLTPMLEAIREDFSRPVGLILPRHPDPDRGRPPAGSLMKHADWTRKYILDEELLACQFPTRVPSRKKAAEKPSYW